jgi:hypothetical protein
VGREQDRDTLTFRAVLSQPSKPEGLATTIQETIRNLLKLRADVAFVSEGELQESEKRILDIRKWD